MNLRYRYAQYSHFKIYSEAEYYKLEIDGYEGNAGDSLNDPWYGSNNSPFSTYNRYVPWLFYFLYFDRWIVWWYGKQSAPPIGATSAPANL